MTPSSSSDLLAIDSQEYRTVARRIDLTTIQLGDRGWTEAVDAYSALEPELLALFQADADKREVRRRICEAIISNISLAEPAPDGSAYSLAWERMLQAGFSNEERRMSMQFFRLTYLIDNSQDAALIDAALAEFHEGVDALLGQPEPGMGEHFSGVYNRVRTRLLRRGEPKT